MNAPTDEQLLASHLSGDPHAFRTLVERHSTELYQFVYRFTNRKSSAEDVVQDTFIQVHLAGQSFDTNRRFKPWLFTIAANKARDHLRSRTRKREVPLDAQVGGDDDDGQRFLDLLSDEVASPAAQLEEAEQSKFVQQIVEEMPAHLSEILILAYFHRFPYRDIADMLDIPLGTVKSRLHAAVAQFGTLYRQRAGPESEPTD
ncbi:MAG TPA: RNA polymerase sigma factor [Phycisphaerae bacterium]|nr:RNA polymerase sigma factor [Phycisphaerales bacterium]HNO76628.1 RNA polymerase sigma factor [Phycisphaerae bacterium]